MAKFKPQVRRQMFIDEVLRRRRTPDTPFPTYKSLCDEWNEQAFDHEKVCTRTIRRDIEWMQDEQGLPIIYDKERKGLRYQEENWSMPAIPINESELFFIFVADRALRQYRNTPMYGKLKAVFDKILASLPPNKVSVEPGWMSVKISFLEDRPRKVDIKIWEEISKALYQDRRLLIRYRKPGARSATTRRVDPYHLVGKAGGTSWYLVGFCHQKNDIRTFALQRITHAERLSTRFSVPEDFDIREIVGSLGVMRARKPYTLKIRFDAESAPYAMEREWFANQEFKQNKDGSVTFISRNETTHFDHVARWVLGWGRGAHVLAPKALAQQVRAELKAAASLYRS